MLMRKPWFMRLRWTQRHDLILLAAVENTTSRILFMETQLETVPFLGMMDARQHPCPREGFWPFRSPPIPLNWVRACFMVE